MEFYPFSFLAPIEKDMERVGTVDLIVGLPSYGPLPSLRPAIEAAQVALSRFSPPRTGLIVVAEGRGHEEARDLIASLTSTTPPVLLCSYPLSPLGAFAPSFYGMPERRKALGAILSLAQRFHAKACAVLDPRLSDVAPARVEALLAPIEREEFDYVSPLYTRPRYEGGLVSSLVYPLTRALYCQDIRYPLGGEFALSCRLISHLLSLGEGWSGSNSVPEVDVWMVLSAVVGGFRICQAHLGYRFPEATPADLPSATCQVVGSLFHLAESHYPLWQRGEPESHLPIFGSPPQPPLPSPSPDPHSLIQAFQRGLRDLLPLWEQALSPETLEELYPLGAVGVDEFKLPSHLWVRIVYDMLLAFHYRVFYWRHLLKSLVPLYLGRLASLILETEQESDEAVEESVQSLCREFTTLRSYLVDRWR